jgi:hypothetical protein
VSKKALSDLGITAATAEDALKVSNLGIHEALFATHNCVGRFIRGIPFHEKYALFDTADQSW